MNELTTETKIEFHKERAIAYLNMAAKNIILVGHELIAIKKELPHGQFQNWVEANLGVTYRQARNWMELAEHEALAKSEISFTFNNLSTTAKTLFLSAPEEVKEQVKAKLDSGEKVTQQEILRLKAELAAKPKEVVKEVIKEVVKEVRSEKDELNEMYLKDYKRRDKEFVEKVAKLKEEVLALKSKIHADEIGLTALRNGGNIKQAKIDTTRMENNLIAKERELREIEKQLEATPVMVKIQVLLPKATPEQLAKILAILEGK
jgi:ethanolamine utilization protein EutQ (cupin superfamily)